MFQKTPREASGLEKTIDSLIDSMQKHEEDSESYSRMVDQLVKLHKLQHDEMPRRVTLDVLVPTLGNIVGILIIVAYESKNVVASKAINFVQKLR